MHSLRQALVVGVATAVIGTASVAAAQDTVRQITNIAGDLYRFQNNFHFSVFLVTDDGIIATDPINAEAAEWLKTELQERFDQPVRYVLYSHHHADHASGGEVFADTAIFVGHENMPAALETDGITSVRLPDIVYSDRMDIALGGKTVELHFVGKNNSDNTTVMRFPEASTIFTVDFISAQRLPFRTLNAGFFPDWIDAIKQVEAMDFDIVAPGHGGLGTPQDVVEHREYLEDLTTEVQAAIDAGKPVETAQAEIKLEKYAEWGSYEDWLQENIAGAYRILTDN